MLIDPYKVEAEVLEALNKVNPELGTKFNWLLDEASDGNYGVNDYDDGKAPPGGFAARATLVCDEEDYSDLDVPIRPVRVVIAAPVRYAPAPTSTRIRVPVESVRDLDELAEDRSGPSGFAPQPRWGW